ncbi:MAG: hypothetical protein FWH14_02255 [Oscillospiraceae bacterium]|nr:hypothetical protein [Oscillospiraceae bacterium]
MNKLTSSVIRGAAAGLVVGAASMAAGSIKRRRVNTMKRKAGKAIKTVSHMISDISSIMR